jgi:hypothetical protein
MERLVWGRRDIFYVHDCLPNSLRFIEGACNMFLFDIRGPLWRALLRNGNDVELAQ